MEGIEKMLAKVEGVMRVAACLSLMAMVLITVADISGRLKQSPIFGSEEMVSFLAEEFQNPARDIPRSLALSAVIINFLYVAVSLVTVGTGVYLMGEPLTALLQLIAFRFGTGAVVLISFLGCLACYCPIHIYVAGFSRLIYAQAREGGLPRFFAVLHPRFQTPHRALLAFLPIALLVLLLSYSLSFDLQTLMNVPCANFLLIYVLGMTAAVRLLPVNVNEKVSQSLTKF